MRRFGAEHMVFEGLTSQAKWHNLLADSALNLPHHCGYMSHMHIA